MVERSISITYDFRPDEPLGGHKPEIKRAFENLGWRVTYYGGGSSNLDRCFLDVKSDTNELDHATLIATLTRLGIPLSDDPYTHTSIYGDVSMESATVDWERVQEHVMQGVRLKVSAVTVRGKEEWFDGGADGMLPTAEVKCEVSLVVGTAIKAPFCLSVDARTEAESLGTSGMNWGSANSVARDSDVEIILKKLPPKTVNLSLRALDIHRSWEVVFRSVPVIE